MLWLAGCLYISDDELAQAIADRRVATGAPRLEGLDPWAGLMSGGEEVVLSGRNLGTDVEVRFGSQLATVTAADAERMYVTAPQSDEEGLVEVSVTRGEDVDRLARRYSYWADGTGLVGATGTMWYFQRRGGYWAESTADAASLSFKFIEPAPAYDYWKYWAPTLDTCVTYAETPYTFVPYDLGAVDPGVTATLTAATAEVTATWDAAYQGFVNEEFPVRTLLTTQSWKLQEVEVAGFPTFATTELMLTPAAWELASPRIDGANLTPTVVSPLALEWSGSGAVSVIVQLGLMDPAGQEFEDEVFCAMVDDGSFEVPAELTEAWPANRDVHVLIGRYVEPAGVLAFNHAGAAVYVVDWRYGALRSQ